MATEQTIRCPHCKTEIPLTETLAAPLLERVRQRHEAELQKHEEALKAREAKLSKQQKEIEKAQESIEESVQARLKSEREVIAKREAARARDAMAVEMKDLHDQLVSKSAMLQEAQKLELDLRRQRQELEEEKRKVELNTQRAIDAERSKIRELSMREAAEQHRMREMEQDKTIEDMKRKIEDLQRRAEQGSQQLRGEVSETDLFETLVSAFPQDGIERVSKGRLGGDVIQSVTGTNGTRCGTILWECKRTKNWSEAWLSKLRDDQRAAKADIAVIASKALPEGIDTFQAVDGVWVTSVACAVPVASALRQVLVQVACVRRAGEGQETKAQLLYNYFTSERFKHRLTGILEPHLQMRSDLEKEKRVIPLCSGCAPAQCPAAATLPLHACMRLTFSRR